jgi:hypothetical protein
MLRLLDFERTKVSEERITSIIKVTGSDKLGTIVSSN